ncbi:MAG: porin family protein [bacterium]|nr:porin family protein [bacterium]
MIRKISSPCDRLQPPNQRWPIGRLGAYCHTSLTVRKSEKGIKVKPCSTLFSLVLILGLFGSVSDSHGQERGRAGRFEVFLFGQGMTGDEAKDTIGGDAVTSEVDSFTAFGIGGGYHLNDYFSVSLDLFAASTDLEVQSGGTVIKEDSDVSGMDFNVDVYPFAGPISPFVTAGIGFVAFYEDLDDYDCSCYDRDEFSTSFSYNLGAGVRWEWSEHFFVKALYRSTWTELEDLDETFQFHGFSLFAGYVF